MCFSRKQIEFQEHVYPLIEAPDKYDPTKHKFGKGWCQHFCKRWSISRRRRTNTKKKDLFQRLHLVRKYHWWIVFAFANPENYPAYWNRDNLPELPDESEPESVSSFSSQSESVSESSWASDTDSSETPSDISDDDHLHESSEEEIESDS